MKLCLVVVLVALSLAEAARIRRDEKYTTKYDNMNLDEILASDRLVDNYFKCVMGKGKCTPDGAELKGECRTLWYLLPRVVTLQNPCSQLHIIYVCRIFHRTIVYRNNGGANIFGTSGSHLQILSEINGDTKQCPC
jgi:hypothetical protein